MFRETLELTAPSVDEAKRRAFEILAVSDTSEVKVVVLEAGDGANFSYRRRPARIRVVRTPEGFGHVARELPDSIPALPPEETKGGARRLTLSSGPPSSRRPRPRPDVIIEEAAPAPSVAEMGIEPSRQRAREAYEAVEGENDMFCEVVESVLEKTGLDYEVEFEHADYQRAFIDLPDRQAGVIIGRGGAGIDALEHIIARMASHRAGHNVPVQVDVNEYREREHEKLRDLALSLAEQALRDGEEIHLEPMNPRDRRVVHLTVKPKDGLETYTVGEGPRRHVVIVPEAAGGGAQPSGH